MEKKFDLDSTYYSGCCFSVINLWKLVNEKFPEQNFYILYIHIIKLTC